jgi:hypothetical protein
MMNKILTIYLFYLVFFFMQAAFKGTCATTVTPLWTRLNRVSFAGVLTQPKLQRHRITGCGSQKLSLKAPLSALSASIYLLPVNMHAARERCCERWRRQRCKLHLRRPP